MERADKLRTYLDKDYSEIIQFPVELVDRDGVVRRYSYEESLAVYHRRIQSAPWRYADDDLIRAEIGHCSRRIDQIKRSYLFYAEEGLGAPSNDPRASLGEGYEILRRHYEGLLQKRQRTLQGDLPVELALLQDEPACRIYHVGFGGDSSGHLLYVFPFDRAGDQDPKEAWDQTIAQFAEVVVGRDVERLLMSHEAGETGYLLTGVLELPEDLEALTEHAKIPAPREQDPVRWLLGDEGQPWWFRHLDDGEPAPGSPKGGDAFDRGLEALREEQLDRASESFVRAVEQNPFHREAYLALLAVLDGTGRYEEAELYGAMATTYLPDDGLLRYRQGINLVRRGCFDEAVQAFDEAAVLDDSLYQPSYFAAHVLIARGQDLSGARERLARAALIAPDEAHIQQHLLQVGRCLDLRSYGRIGLLAIGLVCGLFAVGTSSLVAWVGLGFSALLLVLSKPLLAAVTRWVLQRGGLGGQIEG